MSTNHLSDNSSAVCAVTEQMTSQTLRSQSLDRYDSKAKIYYFALLENHTCSVKGD